jgi:sugar phosphate isomerase/epimerase
MSRSVTLCTAQWADMPMEEMAQKASQWGYDGLELACWGNHFNVQRALTEKEYLPQLKAILDRHNLKCFALATHLVGQAVCDNIDTRHKSILPDHVWGDGDPEGVRQRAAKEVADTARAAAKFGVHQINGFTGSSVWHMIYSFPPNDFSVIEKGYEDFAARWNPVLDVFKQEGAKFGLEVHPTEIAYDFVTTRKALDAIDHRPEFGINYDPSHLIHQFLDPVAFIDEFADRIYHVHAKDSKLFLSGRNSILSSHLNFGDAQRGWDFISVGHGDVPFEAIFRALNRIGYQGPISIEWEDSGMEREWGAQDALAFVRRTDFSPSAIAFDAAFEKK